MKNNIINFFITIVLVFAFCSSVYCLSLIFNHFIGDGQDFIGLSFFICIFIVGILINLKGEK